MSTYLAAVRALHIRLGWSSPLDNTPRLDLILRGIKRLKGAHARPQRLPITARLMQYIKVALPRIVSDVHDQHMFWAAYCLAFFGFLRVGELVARDAETGAPRLAVGDLLIAQSYVTITIRQSKTDPFRRGCDVHIGESGRSVCAVRAVKNYMAARQRTPRREDALLIDLQGRPLRRERFTATLQRCLIGTVPEARRYTAHSFRIGAATSAAQNGVPDWLIQASGRWTSDCFRIYTRTHPAQLRDVARALMGL